MQRSAEIAIHQHSGKEMELLTFRCQCQSQSVTTRGFRAAEFGVMPKKGSDYNRTLGLCFFKLCSDGSMNLSLSHCLLNLPQSFEMSLNPFHHWLGLDPRLTHPNYFQLLGLEEEVEDEAKYVRCVEKAAKEKLALLAQPELSKYADTVEKLRKRIATAAQILADADKRNLYLKKMERAGGNALEPLGPGNPRPSETVPLLPGSLREEIPEAVPLALPLRKADPPKILEESEPEIFLPNLKANPKVALRSRRKSSPLLMIGLSILVVISICGLALVALTLGRNAAPRPEPGLPNVPAPAENPLAANPWKVPEIQQPVGEGINQGGSLSTADNHQATSEAPLKVDEGMLSDFPGKDFSSAEKENPLADGESQVPDQSPEMAEVESPHPATLEISEAQARVANYLVERQFREILSSFRRYEQAIPSELEVAESAQHLRHLQEYFQTPFARSAIDPAAYAKAEKWLAGFVEVQTCLHEFWLQYDSSAQTLAAGTEVKLDNELVVFVDHQLVGLAVQESGYNLHYLPGFVPADLVIAIAEKGRIDDIPRYRFQLASFLAIQPEGSGIFKDRIERLIQQSESDGHDATKFRAFLDYLNWAQSSTRQPLTDLALPDHQAQEQAFNELIENHGAAKADSSSEKPLSQILEAAQNNWFELENLEGAHLVTLQNQRLSDALESGDGMEAIENIQELSLLIPMEQPLIMLETLLKISMQKLDLAQTLKLKQAFEFLQRNSAMSPASKAEKTLTRKIQERIRKLEKEHQLKGMGQILGSRR
jgi:hypothetical protein